MDSIQKSFNSTGFTRFFGFLFFSLVSGRNQENSMRQGRKYITLIKGAKYQGPHNNIEKAKWW
jgi:hypothetical protein